MMMMMMWVKINKGKVVSVLLTEHHAIKAYCGVEV
jgi:hypothetical protein